MAKVGLAKVGFDRVRVSSLFFSSTENCPHTAGFQPFVRVCTEKGWEDFPPTPLFPACPCTTQPRRTGSLRAHYFPLRHQRNDDICPVATRTTCPNLSDGTPRPLTTELGTPRGPTWHTISLLASIGTPTPRHLGTEPRLLANPSLSRDSPTSDFGNTGLEQRMLGLSAFCICPCFFLGGRRRALLPHTLWSRSQHSPSSHARSSMCLSPSAL